MEEAMFLHQELWMKRSRDLKNIAKKQSMNIEGEKILLLHFVLVPNIDLIILGRD